MKKYKFSIVMAAYNVAEYIPEAIESLINQTIGFNNIQLIIVNDGSIDDTDKVVLEYANKYKNIKYIYQENQGVAVARNEGLKRVEGEFVNFLDSDDMLEKNTLFNVYEFFKKYSSAIDIVGIPIVFFDGKEGEHILNRKFDIDKIVDVNKTHAFPQLSSSSSFIKSSVAVKYKFKKGLKYGEDAKYLCDIMSNKMKYGLVTGGKYLYRKRIGENQSALQRTFTSKVWYMDTLEKFHLSIINENIDNKGKLPKYFQYLLMYDLQWRVNQAQISLDVLNKKEISEYKKMLAHILSFIDDSIILEQKDINIRTKINALLLKHNSKFEYKMKNNYTEVFLNNTKLYSIGSSGLMLDYYKIEGDYIILEGFYNVFHNIDKDKLKISLKNKNNIFYAEFFERKEKEIYLLNDRVNSPVGVRFKIPVDKGANLGAEIWINGCTSRVGITFGKFLIPNILIRDGKNKYRIIYRKDLAVLNIKKLTKKDYNQYRYRFLKSLIRRKKYKVILFRALAFINYLRLFRKNIWIIMDRFDMADDSGEHLFKYLRKNHKLKYNFIFVLNKDSLDYKRMKKFGKVMDPNSIRYKLYFLYAKNVISSHAEDKIVNPFGKNKRYYYDLYRFNYTFLQHGITKDDLSTWLNRFNKDIDIFVTAANKEYDSILKGNYYYTKDVVKLTGLPRFDNLNNDNQKREILLMPTWRAYLASKTDSTGKREYSESFKESDFYNYYNNLLNDDKLIYALRDNDIKLLLAPHPNLRVQLCDFEISDVIKIADNSLKYQEMFNSSSLLITDYSSVAFDFAYLKKPVLYFHFDSDAFFSGHSYDKGYFDYCDDGFGKVTYDIKSLVDEIIKVINSDFVMDNKYKARVEKFFMYTDRHNCERVYKEINKLK